MSAISEDTPFLQMECKNARVPKHIISARCFSCKINGLMIRRITMSMCTCTSGCMCMYSQHCAILHWAPSVRHREMLSKLRVKIRNKSCTHFDFVAFGQFKVQTEGIDDGGEQEGFLPGIHTFRRHLQIRSMFQHAGMPVCLRNRRSATALHCTALPPRWNYATFLAMCFLLFKVLPLYV